MKTLYLDCFAGISGDMMVGSLIDLGLNPQVLQSELSKLALEGYRLEVTRVNKLGLQATQFKVILVADHEEHVADHSFTESGEQVLQPEHLHENPAQHRHRELSDILTLVDRSELSPLVKDMVTRIFTRLGEAEAAVHGIPLEEVHFHEVGGADAIIDIASTAIGIEQLDIDRIITSPLHLGTGFIRMSHGLYPIPAPATALLVRNIPVYTTEAKGELVTPTGAAIVAALAHEHGRMPVMTVERIGYGAGTRDRDFPNVLRAFLGDQAPGLSVAKAPPISIPLPRPARTPAADQANVFAAETGHIEGDAIVLEANIDDMQPQLFEILMEHLLEADALDIVFIPVQMKKQRPGILVQIISTPEKVRELMDVVFTHSTTLGVRTYPVRRSMLPREIVQVNTPYGSVRVKIARLSGRVINAAPEYEDCRLLAQQLGISAKIIHAAATSAAADLYQEHRKS